MKFRVIRPHGKNKVWTVRGHTLDGRLIERSTGCTTEREARAWLKQNLARLLREPAPSAPVPSPQPAAAAGSFAAWIEAYILTRDINDRSIAGRHELKRLARLRQGLGDKPVASITGLDLVMLGRTTLPGRVNATLNREVIHPAAAVLNLAANNDARSAFRIRTAHLPEPAPGLRRLLPDEEVRLLLAARPVFRQWLLLLWLFRTGMRIDDALKRVVWPDAARPGEKVGIDLIERTVTLRIGKTQHIHTIDLADDLVAALEQIPVAERHGTLFSPWSTQSSINRWLHPLRERCGVHFTPHMARHTVGARLAEDGQPLPVIMAVLGHRTVGASLRYQSVTGGRIRSAVNRLGASSLAAANDAAVS